MLEAVVVQVYLVELALMVVEMVHLTTILQDYHQLMLRLAPLILVAVVEVLKDKEL
jgi:hypothetical protein